MSLPGVIGLEGVGTGPWQPPGGVTPSRLCVRCGGGLAAADPDGGPCGACRYYFTQCVRGHVGGHQQRRHQRGSFDDLESPERLAS